MSMLHGKTSSRIEPRPLTSERGPQLGSRTSNHLCVQSTKKKKNILQVFYVYMLLEFLERVLGFIFNVKSKILQISILILGRYIRV